MGGLNGVKGSRDNARQPVEMMAVSANTAKCYHGRSSRSAARGTRVVPGKGARHDVAGELEEIVSFGPFRLHRARRKLLCGTQEVRIGGRAMDILLALAARQGALVSKHDLFRAGWPDTFVQDANLKVTIAYLRTALRQHVPAGEFIHTVVGRGYWLAHDASAEEVGLGSTRSDTAIPDHAAIIGRDAEIAQVGDLLAAHRLVSIVGAGGIGKTTVAAAVARAAATDFCDCVTLVDFSRVTNEEFVAPSLATALGIASGGDSLQAVRSILARQKILLVLDTCEHVLNVVAHICEVLLARTAQVRIVVTSRQPLGIRSEKTFWLAPLASPPDDRLDRLDHVLDYPAPRLLVTRASESGGYTPREGDARPLGLLCRRLDGSPLAIELAALRVATRGAAAALDELEDRFLLLRRDSRRGPRRHRTLLVALRWSYALLTVEEATLLRALSVFAGPFDTEAAAHVAASAGLPPIEIVDTIASLRAKSMLSVDHRGGAFRYRMLDSTRLFAGDLLDATDQKTAIATAHARYVMEMLGRSATDQAVMSPRRWRDSYVALIDDLRKALAWTLDRSADPLLGIHLAAAGLPLWHELSLGEEIRAYGERALMEFRRLGCSDVSLELRLVVGLATVSTYLATDPDQASMLFRTAVDLARRTGDPQAECRALAAFATYELMRSRRETVSDALAAMRRAATVVAQPDARWEEEQLRAQYEIRICAFHAALARVTRLFEEMRGEAERAVPRFQIHQKMNVEVQMAALNWLTGRSREAVRVASMAAADARAVEHGLTLVHSLSQGVVWTLMQCGQYEAVLPHIETLRSAIFRHGIAGWIPVADTYVAVIEAFMGRKPDPACLRSAFYGVRAGIAQIQHDARYTLIADAMLANGQPDDAREVLHHILGNSAEPWGRCEILRLLAATERASGRDDAARPMLVMALEAAAASQSLAWTLRASCDLAALLCDHREMQEARALLAPVYARFEDGFETRDLRKARELLARLAR